MCRSGALIHPAALTAEGGGPAAALTQHFQRNTQEPPDACARMNGDTFRDGRVCARSTAGAAPRRGPDGSSSPQIKLNEVGVEAHSGGFGANF